jgi:hypothetical protein
MYKIQPVIEHIEKVYGFEVVPCSIPRDNFQYFKRYIYVKRFNEATENLNISDVSDSKKTAEEILKNCKRYFIESGYRTSDTVILPFPK